MMHFFKHSYIFLCMGLLFFSFSASAHKVNIFASAEGNVIIGYVYYTGGGNPKHATLVVEDGQGNKLGELETDENGEFSITAKTRQDHLFILELADGHRASFTVTADELPASLAVSGGTTAQDQSVEHVSNAEESVLPDSGVDTSDPEQATLSISAEELEELLDKAIAKQLRPLREQLDQYEAKVRLHDVLGGIGYIVGIMGLGYFLSSRKVR